MTGPGGSPYQLSVTENIQSDRKKKTFLKPKRK